MLSTCPSVRGPRRSSGPSGARSRSSAASRQVDKLPTSPDPAPRPLSPAAGDKLASYRRPRIPRKPQIGAVRHWPLVIVAVGMLASAALAADPRVEAAKLNEAGIALVKEGKYAEAVAKLRAARSLLPLDLTLRKNLATAYSEWGIADAAADRPTEAVEKFRFAAALSPDEADFHLRLGLALVRTRDVTGAKRAFEKAVFLDPGSVPARAQLGQILYDEGSLVLAIREWERALAADPARTDVRDRLAHARREYEAEREHDTADSAHFVISFDAGEDRSIGTRVLRLLEDAYEEIGAELGIRPESARPGRALRGA